MSFDHLLVSTKFAPPRLGSRFIRRKHLLEHLRNAQKAALVLVTGSAGFGKTVLLAQWRLELMKAGAAVSWLSLSHDERQLFPLGTHMLAAFKRLGISVEDGVLIDGDGVRTVDALAAQAINGAAAVGRELYLVIDDYHHVEDPWAHKLMQKLLDHCPDNLHIVIASRVAPPLNLARLRVGGRVDEVGFTELPFDMEETRLYFEQGLAAMKLTADEVRLMHDLTNGWPASLQLLASMLKNRPSTRARLHDLSMHSIDLQAYLAEDVVAHLPGELNELLEALSICRRFNAELAAVMTGHADADAMIKRAEEENLLIYRVESDDSSPWYRFHPLFGEFLASRLARRGAGTVNELHRRASRWFADRGLLVEAVRHAIRAGDLEFAVETIEKSAPETWGLAYISPMLNLLERLPQETLFAHPQLFLLGCVTYSLTARHTKAERWVAELRKSEAVRNPAISSRLAIADACIALQRDDSQRTIELLEPLHDDAGGSRFLRYVQVITLGSAYAAAGRFADANKLLDDNPVPLEDRKNDMALVADSTRSLVLLMEGRVQEAARLGSTQLARAEAAHGRRSICANFIASMLGDAYYELDLIDEAREVLANRTGILQSSTPGVMLTASLARARLDLLQNSAEAALAFLDSYAAHYRSLRLDRPYAYMLAEQVRILLDRDERARAAELGAKLDDLAAAHRDARGFLAEIPAVVALAQARLALAEKLSQQALDRLEVVCAHADRYGRGRNRVLADLLKAVALEELGRREDASASLLQALESGSRLGLVRTFLDERERAGRLLAALAPHLGAMQAPLADYLSMLRSRLGGSASVPAAQRESAAPLAKADVNLTPREVEILGLVSQAMSNKRIALTLNITVETVKWNIKNILGKLGVSSRYDAMTWARKNGLID
ncbi:LuxR C-terminal-related transcriptional regulator [Ramlibacter tataouinensis]|uniref:HTH luxR-type domain-containing protein n=1 Tax=Ramlibacter tataouinensis TaxID=94132 RepID=A0A127JVW4_9BURK|nr:LuxR C-terminal-related transcriptional regulator [Ramlibacter tataouinensis]AMO24148.1 hypothetical protein UC35_16505 [Ramlibacter tataouinensis]